MYNAIGGTAIEPDPQQQLQSRRRRSVDRDINERTGMRHIGELRALFEKFVAFGANRAADRNEGGKIGQFCTD